MIRILIIILLLSAPVAAETITVTDSHAGLDVITQPSGITTTQATDTITSNPLLWGIENVPPPLAFADEIDSLRQLYIYAGAVWAFNMQMRLADLPQPFGVEGWPTAEFRTARSPGGTQIMALTTEIDDEPNAIWSYRLTAAQTAALNGRSMIMEISFPDAPGGGYQVHNRIPITVRPHVTE